MMKRYILTLPLILLLAFSQVLSQTASKAIPESAGMSASRLMRYSDFLDNEIEEKRLAGTVSMIYRKGQLVHQSVKGVQDLEAQTPMKGNSLFYIQSMTKPIISVGIMMLYEEGHFFLNDPVSKYLPQFKDLKVALDKSAGKDGETEAMKGQITIAHLLSHTAGFSHGLADNALEREVFKTLYFQPHANIEARVNALLSMPMIGHPGEQWHYSASPDVLALLIEHFSGMTAKEFIQKRIFDPLGMVDTGYNLNKEQQERKVTNTQMNEEGTLILSAQQAPSEGNTIYGGTHGLYSTAGDYMKFCQMLLNGGQYNGHQLLSRKTIDLMRTNHTGDLRNVPGHGFGLGFGVKTDLADSKSLGSVGQYYWSGANNTYFFIDPAEELIAILMTQKAPYTNYYAEKLRQFVYQAIVD